MPAPLTGIDAGLLERGTPALFRRDPAYATDAEAFRAVLDDPALAIVPEGFLVTWMGTATFTTNTQRPDALVFYESLGFEITHQGLKLYLQGDVTGR
jgi:hypothetical protein